ncbi:Proteasome lid subunit RPN8/RPN11, contains Jab1/MPN metalloenzyme (JAMM) motif [Pseudobutyrivibrio sp. YE44]|uniref:Mov34/MPN/PAD-1 family protein n=1 Tax=Pseudobutyrivibrio sp. YE44 TaxID=1520802 RepID=UPI0008873DE8|nr:M67 family metallopeptidase [Pseudobutyrivibrio sp. YE44]SDB14477.1 Proteasome lid subunit RPN8/RPN11, contains Jab1/MPN metalloenzyme (JAMM) motif [Pseudobutyrivibrio sp. YE44]
MGNDIRYQKEELKYVVADSLCKRLVRSVEEKYPREACGIILGKLLENNTIVITNYVSVENSDSEFDQDRHYTINPLKLYSYENTFAKDGNEIIGFYHSHPDAIAYLSEEDKKYMIPEQLYLILEVQAGITLHRNVWKKSIEDDSISRVNIKVKGE